MRTVLLILVGAVVAVSGVLALTGAGVTGDGNGAVLDLPAAPSGPSLTADGRELLPPGPEGLDAPRGALVEGTGLTVRAPREGGFAIDDGLTVRWSGEAPGRGDVVDLRGTVSGARVITADAVTAQG